MHAARPVTTDGAPRGWDATFSAPKSVSLTALVGGDTRVREAHRESVAGGPRRVGAVRAGTARRQSPAGDDREWVAAMFEHDSARPVDGYAAPQLHTHVVFFNLTERTRPRTRAAATAGTVQVAAVRDGRVPIGAGGAIDGLGLRDRARS